MPLPTPRSGEKRNDFVSRCMSNSEAKRDFPENDQRLAVCFSQLRKSKGGNPPSKNVDEEMKALRPILKLFK